MWGLNDVLTNSIAYGMGEEEGRAKAEKEKKKDSPWHTGTPTEDGYYLVHMIIYGEEYDLCMDFKDGIWDDRKWGFDFNSSILAWQKITPYEGEKE